VAPFRPADASSYAKKIKRKEKEKKEREEEQKRMAKSRKSREGAARLDVHANPPATTFIVDARDAGRCGIELDGDYYETQIITFNTAIYAVFVGWSESPERVISLL